MGSKSTSDQYGSVAVTIHWLTAVLIVILLGSGFRAGDAVEAADKVFFLRFHVPIGLLVFALTIFRIAWWVFADKKPGSVAMPRWQTYLSNGVHIILYVTIIGMSSSGIGMMVLSGAGPHIFGSDPSQLPDFWEYIPRIPHGIVARVMLGLLVLHVGAALYHHFFMRDGLVSRMWFTRK